MLSIMRSKGLRRLLWFLRRNGASTGCGASQGSCAGRAGFGSEAVLSDAGFAPGANLSANNGSLPATSLHLRTQCGLHTSSE